MSADDVRQAAAILEGQVLRTPVLRSEVLDQLAGAELWLKAENLQHIGAFKARGALHAVARLSDEERARGIITYSSGNHAQAVALAAARHGLKARIAMPEDAPPIKVAAVKALGAEITFAGLTSDDRKKRALAMAEETGAVIIEPFDHPHIVAGQGTATLELLEDADELDALLVPVGGGGVIAGACLVAEERGLPVYSVEPVGCDAMAQSLEAGERVPVQPGPTIADGLKPVMVGALNFAIAKRVVTRPLRVDDDAIARALTTLAAHAKTIVEPSGAATTAAALATGEGSLVPELTARLGRRPRLGLMLSGGNYGLDQLAELVGRYPAPPRPLAGPAAAG